LAPQKRPSTLNQVGMTDSFMVYRKCKGGESVSYHSPQSIPGSMCNLADTESNTLKPWRMPTRSPSILTVLCLPTPSLRYMTVTGVCTDSSLRHPSLITVQRVCRPDSRQVCWKECPQTTHDRGIVSEGAILRCHEKSVLGHGRGYPRW
jgi:hypothetical protein